MYLPRTQHQELQMAGDGGFGRALKSKELEKTGTDWGQTLCSCSLFPALQGLRHCQSTLTPLSVTYPTCCVHAIVSFCVSPLGLALDAHRYPSQEQLLQNTMCSRTNQLQEKLPYALKLGYRQSSSRLASLTLCSLLSPALTPGHLKS